MKIYLFGMICLLVFFSCTGSRAIINNTHQTDIESKYQIMKIKLIEDKIYVIYAQRNDSLYKILSPKWLVPILHCTSIQEKGAYPLILKMFYPHKELLGNTVHTSHTVTGITIYENVVVEIEESSHHSLYRAENLKGLCIIEN